MLAASRVVTFTLSDADVTFFEVNADIATGIGDTYLSALPGLVQDTNGNPNLLVSASSPVPVSNFTGDISRPRVLAFDLDMNVGALAVTFDDPVNVSTFNVSAITLQGSPSAHQPRDWYTLSEGYLSSSSHGFVVTVFLGDVDLNQVKLISSLCTEVHNCYMSVTSSIVLDPNEVDADPIGDDSAIQVRQFIADTTHPEVLDWALDMNNGVIFLRFSEVVDRTTFQPDQLTLQNMYSLETDTVSFTPSQSVLYFSFAHFLTSFLGVDDINTIKALTNIGTNVNNSLLSITANMIRDTNSNNVVAIPSSMALQALYFIPDTTIPTLVSFSLNINIGILSLTFDETVNAITFSVSALTLLNQGSLSLVRYTLTGGSVSDRNSATVHIMLSEGDFNAIRGISNLATSPADTYIIASLNTVEDMNGNPLLPILEVAALAVTHFVDSPILVSFQFANYTVSEGEIAMLLVVLNTTASTEVTFDALTLDSEAVGKSTLSACLT